MSISFHRTFSLSRSSLAKILSVTKEHNKFSAKALEKTDLGTIYREAMPRYARRAGLLDQRGNLTTFGRFVSDDDIYLQRIGTQWLLHYHLAAPHRPTAFWHELVRRFFLPGNTFTAQDLNQALTDFLHCLSDQEPAPRSIRSAVTVFIGTYLKNDGLGYLGLLKEIDQNTYQVSLPSPPPAWAVGYALADYWQAKYEGRLTINLDDLIGENFANLFLLGENGLTEVLIELKRGEMVDLYRISRPYQVVLLQPNPEFALERLYESD